MTRLPGAHVLRLDLRSLALSRVLFGLVFLADSLVRLFDATRFYSDWGVLPRAVLLRQGWLDDYLSLYMMSGKPWFACTLLAFQASLAVALLLGYRTRPVTFLSWVMLVSVDNRNPWILNGGDHLARMFLLWMQFLPWGQCWSLDAKAGRADTRWWTCPLESATSTAPSLCGFALLLQLSLLYWFAALPKNGAAWVGDYSAVYIVLKYQALVSPFGEWLREAFHQHLGTVTFLVVWWEFLGPFLFFFPFDRGEVRTLAIFTFLGMHAGFELSLRLGMFAWFCMAILPSLLPARFWELSSRLLRRSKLPEDGPPAATPSRGLSVIRESLVGFMLAWVVLWNFQLEGMRPNLWVPRALLAFGITLRLDQHWNMFSPHPPYQDGWWVLRAVRRDSTVFNAADPQAPLSWKKPPDISGSSLNQRRRRWMIEIYLNSQPNIDLLQATGAYLTRQFNGTGMSLHEVSGIEFYYLSEDTDVEGHESKPVRTLVYTFQARPSVPVPQVPLEDMP